MNTCILIKGELVDIGREVRLWSETGLAFKDHPKRPETRAVWLHHTGGERGGPGVFETLCGSRVSANALIDQRGVLWQYCDFDVATAHAGGERVFLSANPWAASIEFANRANAQAHHKSWPRELATDFVCGSRIKATRLYPEQIATGVAAVEKLCAFYGLPMDVPRNAAGELETGRLSRDELLTFRGVGGHYHNHRSKLDPHTEVLRAVAVRGEALGLRAAT